MVGRLLPACTINGADAADALAVAICHAHTAASGRRWAEAEAGAAGGGGGAGGRAGGSRAARRPVRIGRPDMIGKLSGLVDSAGADWAIVDVSGVGYVVHCSGRGFAALPGQGEPVSLWIETHVREDHISISTDFPRPRSETGSACCPRSRASARAWRWPSSRSWRPDDLIQAIAAQDQRAVARANGVGPKLAGRIVTELKDKAGQFALGPAAALAGGAAGNGGGAADGVAGGGAAPLSEDAISALVNLGYQRSEAFGAVAQATRSLGAEASLEAVIKAGLKELSA